MFAAEWANTQMDLFHGRDVRILGDDIEEEINLVTEEPEE